MLSFPVPVLSFLFVSFRPSRLRSHSCSTGASLPLSLPGFSACLPLPFGRFGLLLTTQPSVFPFPSSRSPLTAVPSVRDRFFRPCRFPLSIPVLSFLRFPFSARCFVSQALHSRRPPVSSSAAPLAFALGSGYLALSFWVLVPRSDLTYISTTTSNCQHLFFIFFNYYLVCIYQFTSKSKKIALPSASASNHTLSFSNRTDKENI